MGRTTGLGRGLMLVWRSLTLERRQRGPIIVVVRHLPLSHDNVRTKLLLQRQSSP